MLTPEGLERHWAWLDDDQRDIVAATLALLAALEGAPVEWAEWVIDVLEARIVNAEERAAMRVWREAIEGWE